MPEHARGQDGVRHRGPVPRHRLARRAARGEPKPGELRRLVLTIATAVALASTTTFASINSPSPTASGEQPPSAAVSSPTPAPALTAA
ncbi:MAG TPA: hypothetical protein VJS86_06130, partial [Arthrobacter sp.]|nr:hypothetical protein [Arthrobacter sp.]